MLATVLLGTQRKTCVFSAPVPLYQLITDCGIPFDLPCGGHGRCKKCLVKAVGALCAPTQEEKAALTPAQLQQNCRLACCAQALGDVQIELFEKAGEQITTQLTMPEYTFTPGLGLGFAVDIGTTTLAAYFYDRATGELLYTASRANPQSVFGADVISRLEKSIAGQGAQEAACIRSGIAQMLTQFLQETGRTQQELTAGVLTGNTAMLYLLCGQDVDPISKVPFTLTRPFGEYVCADALQLPAAKDAPVYLPRCFSAYVGGDINTAVLASGMVRGGRVVHDRWMLADIGTNGEIVLSNRGELVCCSTAAGPAFEGAGITMGMRASAGAICGVEVQQGKIVTRTVGDVPAVGICGSGLVDAIAVLLDCGVIDETGVILEEDHDFLQDITEYNDQPAFRFPGTQVLLTQKDVRSVQMAKSAVCAGMQALLHKMDMSVDDVEKLVIAGGFGSNISVKNAERIGLICPGFAQKSVCVGNAAGAGASLLLLSEPEVQNSEALHATALELATDEVFMDTYIEGMYFTV